MACEDYPCCGHEENGCPDAEGRYKCVLCGAKLPKGATSAICKAYHPREMVEDALEGNPYD